MLRICDHIKFSLINRMATYYTKVMERVQSKGDSFVTVELDRLKRLMGKAGFLLLCVTNGQVVIQ